MLLTLTDLLNLQFFNLPHHLNQPTSSHFVPQNRILKASPRPHFSKEYCISRLKGQILSITLLPHTSLTMSSESHAKIAGKKGGLAKQIRQHEEAGEEVPPELRKRMDDVTQQLQRFSYSSCFHSTIVPQSPSFTERQITTLQARTILCFCRSSATSLIADCA